MKHTLDMSKGSPLKALILFSLPIIIGNLFQQFYNLMDIAIVGNKLGGKSLAAVGATAALYGLFLSLAYGFSNGFSLVIARYFGAKDQRITGSHCTQFNSQYRSGTIPYRNCGFLYQTAPYTFTYPGCGAVLPLYLRSTVLRCIYGTLQYSFRNPSCSRQFPCSADFLNHQCFLQHRNGLYLYCKLSFRRIRRGTCNRFIPGIFLHHVFGISDNEM